MAEKSFGIKELNLIGASGTPTIESPNNLNLNAVNVAISTNVSVGGTLTVSGNVSVGGTLIYDDVTNIDSVGLITARNGLIVTAGVSTFVGFTSFRDDANFNDGAVLIFDQTKGGRIYANGSHFIIEGTNPNEGTYVKGGNKLILSAAGQTGTHQDTIVVDKPSGNGRCKLYYGGNSKLETTSTGIDIAGSVNIINFSISSNSASAYRFSGGGVDNTEDNPDIYLIRGHTYRFENTTGSGHPFAIRSAVTNSGGTNYTNGVSGNQNNYQTFTVPLDAPSNLYYQCTSHTQNMQGNIIVTGGSQTGGVTYELISQGASIAAGTYVDISGYKAVYFQGHNDPATNGNNRNGPYISTSNSSNSGVSTQNGRWWRLTYSAYSSASHSPSTSALYYGANSFDDVDKVWMLEIMGLDQTNVFLRTSAHNSNSTFPTSGWSANTQSAISTPYLYFHQALLQYIVYGVK